MAIQDIIEIDGFSVLIKEFKKQVSDLIMDDSLRCSLIGRIDQLKRESIARAIQKLVSNCLPGDIESLKIIKDAYNIRSTVLHDGSTDADLREKSNQVEEVIRKVFESLISPHSS
ncbi:hypothetical protein [Methylocucumis oryzae]|uniref:Apea-like HEPN domain-containing protein n=1 Tax=Methylocucumis oryzae TaxID=1632867 RepID=A0A0F3IEX9_9GAMM|nr:hypothetical protein [Methylocucumis oryzae]KJV05375.1 hypothetical protein VZ94_18615 [Methylocucumis oryzae]